MYGSTLYYRRVHKMGGTVYFTARFRTRGGRNAHDITSHKHENKYAKKKNNNLWTYLCVYKVKELKINVFHLFLNRVMRSVTCHHVASLSSVAFIFWTGTGKRCSLSHTRLCIRQSNLREVPRRIKEQELS